MNIFAMSLKWNTAVYFIRSNLHFLWCANSWKYCIIVKSVFYWSSDQSYWKHLFNILRRPGLVVARGFIQKFFFILSNFKLQYERKLNSLLLTSLEWVKWNPFWKYQMHSERDSPAFVYFCLHSTPLRCARSSCVVADVR